MRFRPLTQILKLDLHSRTTGLRAATGDTCLETFQGSKVAFSLQTVGVDCMLRNAASTGGGLLMSHNLSLLCGIPIWEVEGVQ